MSLLSRLAVRGLARRGLVVQRHHGARRQALFAAHGVTTVFDVGAARGAYARELREFGYPGRIVSFEPLGAAYEDLTRAIEDDRDWVAHRLALGETSGEASINVASNSDSSSLLPLGERHREAAPHVDYVSSEQVRVSSLDEIAPRHLADGEVAFLKIDTQGFEKQVLAGAGRTLTSCAGMQLELSFVPLYSGDMQADEAISWAYAQGFHLTGIIQGFTSPEGPVLQADGVFFRDPPNGP